MMGLPEGTINIMTAKSSLFYRTFFIPKRRGDVREISAPIPHLLHCQRWILTNILSRSRIHDAAHGGVAERSILTNASLHTNADSILKMDIKDFFPSIRTARGIGAFRRLGYPLGVSTTLALLCFHKGSLPQGGACSAAIANSVVYKMDCRLDRLSKKFGLSYSRYIDDLTFSGERIGIGFSDLVSAIALDEGFKTHRDKTRLMRGNSPKFVTGLSLSSGSVRVPRSFKRNVRNEAFQILQRGIESHMDHLEQYDPLTIDRVLGRLSYWLMVEPNSSSAAHLFDKLKDYAVKTSAPDEALPPRNLT